MNNQHGLLPWILGGLSVATLATVAVVITVASVGKTLAPGLSPVGSTSAQEMSVPDSLSLPAPAPVATAAAAAPAVAPAPAFIPDTEAPTPQAAQAQPSADPAVQEGQIWECVTNGIKTFSNNPCGEKSTLLEVRAINTMNPTSVVRYARSYAPQNNSPAYGDQGSYSDQDTYGEPGADTAVNSYTVVQGLAFLPQRRPDHLHHRQPFHHDPGRNPGDNPGHSPGHNPGPPPRRN